MERNLKESCPRFYSKVLIPLETEVHHSNVIRELISPVLPKRKGNRCETSHTEECATADLALAALIFRVSWRILIRRGGRREPTMPARARCGWSLTGSPN